MWALDDLEALAEEARREYALASRPETAPAPEDREVPATLPWLPDAPTDDEELPFQAPDAELRCAPEARLAEAEELRLLAAEASLDELVTLEVSENEPPVRRSYSTSTNAGAFRSVAVPSF